MPIITGRQTPDARNPDPWTIMEHQALHEFIRNTFSRQKLQQLCVNTALGNFVGYVAGSLVVLLTTYQTVERRALKNLFGILPRETVVVHRLPEWLEWTLSVLLGYLVMELVRHVMKSNWFLLLIEGSARGTASQSPLNARAPAVSRHPSSPLHRAPADTSRE